MIKYEKIRESVNKISGKSSVLCSYVNSLTELSSPSRPLLVVTLHGPVLGGVGGEGGEEGLDFPPSWHVPQLGVLNLRYGLLNHGFLILHSHNSDGG